MALLALSAAAPARAGESACWLDEGVVVIPAVVAGEAGDWANGNLGDDDIIGGAGNDTLLGGQGDDFLGGGDGDDYLSGDLGDDELSGGMGAPLRSAAR